MKAVKQIKQIKKTVKKPATTVAATDKSRTAPPTTTATGRTKAAPVTTTIEAKIDVGFGNNLFVRGRGAGLSWEQGTPLKCLDGRTWQWSAKATSKLTFKLLLNDAIWAKGDDVVVTPGQRIEIIPAF
jgi:hypothetical protein